MAPKINKEGSIIYFSGGAADKGSVGGSIVGALNAALYGLARNLAYELSPIRVNVISPGLVASPTWDFMNESDRNRFYENAAQSLPVKRVGMPEDIAETAIYLMKNKYSTGAVVTVDGGSNA
jgi:NAD(P)-dependent dehydrogenase (short-subunit alcohol dehydrogenase family)